MPKDLVERECSSLFSRGRQKKRELLLVSTHTENFCTSYHGNIHLEERNRPLGTSILKPFEREMPRSTSRKEETGQWICADTRCVCTSCTYSPASQADHFPTPRGTESWLLLAHSPLVKPPAEPRAYENITSLHLSKLKTCKTPAASWASLTVSS